MRGVRCVFGIGAVVSALLLWTPGPLLPASGAPENVHVGAQSLPTLDVAAASDLRFALEEIAGLFERAGGARVRATFGSSGQLASQIEQGAPFDAFFSADEALVQALVRKGLIVRETVRLYAMGRIVLWVRTASPLDPTGGLTVLLDERVRFVAIAHPEHAPYGRAAVAALHAAGVYDRVRPGLVFGENVSQALQFAQTGNADAGIVALSLAVAPTVRPTGRYWIVPSSLHSPIRQAAGVVARSPQPQRARAFLAFVSGPAGRPVMRRFGFTLPGEGL